MGTRRKRVNAAIELDRELERIVHRGSRRAARDMSRFRRVLREKVAAGDSDVDGFIEQHYAQQAPMFRDAMTLTYLKGYRAAVENAREHVRSNATLSLNIFENEVAKEGVKAGFAASTVEIVRQQMEAEILSTLSTSAQAMQRAVRKTVDRAIAEGLTTREAQKNMQRAIKGQGITTAKPFQLEAIYRTKANESFNAGRWAANQTAGIQTILWGYEYVTVGDDRVRDEHVPFEGTKLPKDDPRWLVIWPPNGWQCRCTTIEIYNDEEDAKLEEPKEGAEVAPGFRFNAGEALAGIGPA